MLNCDIYLGGVTRVAGRFIELLFVFVEAVFVAPRSEELGIAT